MPGCQTHRTEDSLAAVEFGNTLAKEFSGWGKTDLPTCQVFFLVVWGFSLVAMFLQQNCSRFVWHRSQADGWVICEAVRPHQGVTQCWDEATSVCDVNKSCASMDSPCRKHSDTAAKQSCFAMTPLKEHCGTAARARRHCLAFDHDVRLPLGKALVGVH